MLRVAILELAARWDATEESLSEVDALLTTGESTDLVVLPELSFTGYVSPEGAFDLTRFGESIDGPTIREAAKLARKHGTHLVVPLVMRGENEKLHNASICLNRKGEVIATYRKRHPWFPERWATPGILPLPLFEIDGKKTTLAICYDGHFLAYDSPGILTAAGLLIFTSAWVDAEDSRIPLLSSLARQFDLTIVNANWGQGGILEIPGQGGSCIIDPKGSVLAEVTPPSRRADAVII